MIYYAQYSNWKMLEIDLDVTKYYENKNQIFADPQNVYGFPSNPTWGLKNILNLP